MSAVLLASAGAFLASCFPVSTTYYQPRFDGRLSRLGCDGGGPLERLEIELADKVQTQIWISEVSAERLLVHVDFFLAPGNSLRILDDRFIIASEADPRGELKISEIRAALADPSAKRGVRLATLAPHATLEGGMREARNPLGQVMWLAENRYELAFRGSVPPARKLTVAYPRMEVNGTIRPELAVPFERRTEVFLVVNC